MRLQHDAKTNQYSSYRALFEEFPSLVKNVFQLYGDISHFQNTVCSGLVCFFLEV